MKSDEDGLDEPQEREPSSKGRVSALMLIIKEED
jgi:hypothetical protein